MLPRTVAFVNAGKKVNPDMVKKFTELGVPLLQAKPGSGTLGKGHAEAAAAGLRNTNAAGQQAILGGQMADVRAAISSTRACSDDCGTDMSTFIGSGQLGRCTNRSVQPRGTRRRERRRCTT